MTHTARDEAMTLVLPTRSAVLRLDDSASVRAMIAHARNARRGATVHGVSKEDLCFCPTLTLPPIDSYAPCMETEGHGDVQLSLEGVRLHDLDRYFETPIGRFLAEHDDEILQHWLTVRCLANDIDYTTKPRSPSRCSFFGGWGVTDDHQREHRRQSGKPRYRMLIGYPEAAYDKDHYDIHKNTSHVRYQLSYDRFMRLIDSPEVPEIVGRERVRAKEGLESWFMVLADGCAVREPVHIDWHHSLEFRIHHHGPLLDFYDLYLRVLRVIGYELETEEPGYISRYGSISLYLTGSFYARHREELNRLAPGWELHPGLMDPKKSAVGWLDDFDAGETIPSWIPILSYESKVKDTEPPFYEEVSSCLSLRPRGRELWIELSRGDRNEKALLRDCKKLTGRDDGKLVTPEEHRALFVD